jgi:hypothetical protein
MNILSRNVLASVVNASKRSLGKWNREAWSATPFPHDGKNLHGGLRSTPKADDPRFPPLVSDEPKGFNVWKKPRFQCRSK